MPPENSKQEIKVVLRYNNLKCSMLVIQLNALMEKKTQLAARIEKEKNSLKQFFQKKTTFKKNFYSFVIANNLSKLSLVKKLQVKRQDKFVELQSLISELEDELVQLEEQINDANLKINRIKSRIEKLKYISEMEDL